MSPIRSGHETADLSDVAGVGSRCQAPHRAKPELLVLGVAAASPPSQTEPNHQHSFSALTFVCTLSSALHGLSHPPWEYCSYRARLSAYLKCALQESGFVSTVRPSRSPISRIPVEKPPIAADKTRYQSCNDRWRRF